VGSHLDLVPTLLEFAGLGEEEIHERYPHLEGRSLRSVVLDPESDGPRGSERSPGDGALLCWDGLHSLDKDWAISGALQSLTNLGTGPAPQVDPVEQLHEAGRRYGAPDFRRRTFFRTVVDGQYKLVRWFSPEEYDNPATVDQLYATGDVTLHDLVKDPGELENLAHPEHPRHDRALVGRMLSKLHALVAHEIGDDRAPFDLDLFGTREVRYGQGESRVDPAARAKVKTRKETSRTSAD
jgi:arylsulfatase